MKWGDAVGFGFGLDNVVGDDDSSEDPDSDPSCAFVDDVVPAFD